MIIEGRLHATMNELEGFIYFDTNNINNNNSNSFNNAVIEVKERDIIKICTMVCTVCLYVFMYLLCIYLFIFSR